jgi:hypothetical protein
MNTKHLTALMALGAVLSAAAPAAAATQTGSVTVEWNYAITATLNMYTQTTASATHGSGSTVYWGGNGSTVSGCENTTDTATAGTDASANKTVNYGNVVADSVKYTDCLETNAIDLNYITNDSAGANFSVTETGAPTDYDTATNGSLLCIMPNGWAVGTTGAANPAWTTSARNATNATVVATNACPAGDQAITSANTEFFDSNASTANADLNQDLDLVLGPQAQSGQQTLTVTYTLTTN